MTLTDKEKAAAGFVHLVGPFITSIGKKAGNEDMAAVGAIVSKLPIEAVLAMFARLRHDLIKIESGTMGVGDGVGFEVED